MTGWVRQWCAWAEEVLEEDYLEYLPRKDGWTLAVEVDFANNEVGDEGLLALLRLLHDHRIAVGVLKLHNNQLGRGAASVLASWLVETPIALKELHLSHNFIPREGAVDIFRAVAFNGAYPLQADGERRAPLWLRIEQNIVHEAGKLLYSAEGDMKKIRSVQDSGSSAPMLCDCSFDCNSKECMLCTDLECPVAHVKFMHKQRRGVELPRTANRWNWRRDADAEARKWRVDVSRDLRPKSPACKRRRGQ